MNTDLRENHIDYVEFPVTSAPAFAAVKKFYHDVFGWSFQDWGPDYADTNATDSAICSDFHARVGITRGSA